MGKGGQNRDWGYASYDVDRYDDYGDDNLGYTSYENGGEVNKYFDNGDGGHSHSYYASKDDYNLGNDPDYSRQESNSRENPTVEEVQNGAGGCYLTTACMKHMQEEFDDNCEELTILRWFRDKFVSEEDINHYYKTAPIIVAAIDKLEDNKKIYEYIYENVVDACVKAIKNKDYDFAYKRYKSSILALEEQYARRTLEERLAKALKLKSANN